MVDVVGNPITLENLRVTPVITVDATGAYVAAGSDATAANQVLANTKLDTLHTDLNTTLHTDVTSTNTKLDTLHTDIVANTAALGTGREWETVAASQTDQALGATGAASDDLDSVLIIPATLNPGAVSIKDGAGSAITIFTGGTGSVSSLIPFSVNLNLRSLNGAWKLTTGANVSAIGIGNFT